MKRIIANNKRELVKVLEEDYGIKKSVQTIYNYEKRGNFPKTETPAGFVYDLQAILIYICGEKLGTELFTK